MKRSFVRGFTLIELLIVVAIIAILAAIAVPNFLEAQTRAKVSRAKTDLRTYAVAIEAYGVDNSNFPVWLWPDESIDQTNSDKANVVLVPLSTPVAYLTSSNLSDPFLSMLESNLPTDPFFREYEKTSYKYYSYYRGLGRNISTSGGKFLTTLDDPSSVADSYFKLMDGIRAAGLFTQGPARGDLSRTLPHRFLPFWIAGNQTTYIQRMYDPTNGTMSNGAICRFVGDTRGIPSN